MEAPLGTLIMLTIPAYLILQVHTLLWLRGRWRVAALLPLLAMGPLAAVAIKLLAEESNLWPLPLLMAGPVAALYLLVLAVVRLLSVPYKLRPVGGMSAALPPSKEAQS